MPSAPAISSLYLSVASSGGAATTRLSPSIVSLPRSLPPPLGRNIPINARRCRLPGRIPLRAIGFRWRRSSNAVEQRTGSLSTGGRRSTPATGNKGQGDRLAVSIGAIEFFNCALGVAGVFVSDECNALAATSTIVEKVELGNRADTAEETLSQQRQLRSKYRY